MELERRLTVLTQEIISNLRDPKLQSYNVLNIKLLKLRKMCVSMGNNNNDAGDTWAQ